MSAFAKETCIGVLLTLATMSFCTPHGIAKRSTADTNNNSKVEYALAADLESKNEIFEKDATPEAPAATKTEDAIIEATKDASSDKEPSGVLETLPAEGPLAVDRKETANEPTLMPQDHIGEDEAKKADSVMPKPDDKDEKPFEGEFSPDEYGAKEGRLDIGQIPILLPPFIHMMLRPRTFGGEFPAVPPAVDISDRLPHFEAEGAEEATAESGDQMVKGMSRGRFEGPMGFGMPPLPMIPLQAILRDLSGESKLPGATESEVLDVKGKKMLLQKKVLSFPSGDKSRFHLRIMSVQPLEHADPEVLKGVKGDKGFDEKEVKGEEENKKEDAGVERKIVEEESKPLDGKFDLELPKEIEKRKDPMEKEIEAKEKDLPKEVKLFPQSDILKAEETKVSEPVYVEAGEKIIPKVESDSDKAEDESKEETEIKGKIGAAEEEEKGEASAESEVKSSEEKNISKEKKDSPREDMDLGGGVFYEKKKITHEKEKKELFKKKDKKGKKCKCEEKEKDSDSDDDEDDN